MSLTMALAVPFIALCLIMIYWDLRFMRIPDAISVSFAILFIVYVLAAWPEVDLMARLLTAVFAFAICFLSFFFRVMGGGDTKVIPAMALFIPAQSIAGIALLFSGCLLISILFVLLLRKLRSSHPQGWAVFSSEKLPMGLAIGSTGTLSQIAQLV